MAPTLQVTAPPQGEGRQDLSVEISTAVGWRIENALWYLKRSGRKMTKKAFVEQLVVDGLDHFDELERSKVA